MEGPKSVELKKAQVIEILRKILAVKAKPADRVIPRKVLETVEGMAEFDKDGKRFRPPANEAELQARGQAIVEARDAKDATPEIKAAKERELQELNAELNNLVKHWVEDPVFVPWDRSERKFIWEQFRKEFEGECTIEREDQIVDIGNALGKSGEIADMLAEAVEEHEKNEKAEEETPEPAKPELVK